MNIFNKGVWLLKDFFLNPFPKNEVNVYFFRKNKFSKEEKKFFLNVIEGFDSKFIESDHNEKESATANKGSALRKGSAFETMMSSSSSSTAGAAAGVF